MPWIVIPAQAGNIATLTRKIGNHLGLPLLLGCLSLTQTSLTLADNTNGKNLYLQRCALCHGADIKGTGSWLIKAILLPPT
ncbi:hypothetical protein FBY09_101144 [Pseudomonas sp. SJZ101]|nr:hypothetical protein FBY00_10184 [Pseudomonas sp. SJZ075]TWC38264.1 hypothetical protein FBY02_101291 [Pseudomonas sp. SJZ078]TWC58854.1 hypothetical protein FBY11_101291 [Pseudomonas sp. SJZ124]TWC94281.1 hypothetical protein FBY09_101144 [Pseudomonas sp. SJZ101]